MIRRNTPFRRLTKAPRRKARQRKRPESRRSLIEMLEPRQMLASDFNNALSPLDVSGDGAVTEEDLTLILEELDDPRLSDPNTGELLAAPAAPAGWINDLPSGAVDQGELDGMLLNWGAQTTIGDYDGSGVVDQGDLDLVLLNWGFLGGEVIAAPPHLDVDCDGHVSPIDAAYVTNWLTDPTSFDGQQIGRITHQMFPSWTVAESDGSAEGRGGVTSQGCTAVLSEGDSFVVSMSADLTIPAPGSAIQITYDQLSFDESDTAFINDAFEIALVDHAGNPLVEHFALSRDALFNVSEEAESANGDAIQVDGQTITVGLNDIPVGTEATLVLRLVNNDGDTGTSVRITDVAVIDSDFSGGAPRQAIEVPFLNSSQPILPAPNPADSSAPITVTAGMPLPTSPPGEVTELEPVLEWSWTSSSVLPNSLNVIMTPAMSLSAQNRPARGALKPATFE